MTPPPLTYPNYNLSKEGGNELEVDKLVYIYTSNVGQRELRRAERTMRGRGNEGGGGV